jgi:RNA polymerase sigma factor (sigma-70 family)
MNTTPEQEQFIGHMEEHRGILFKIASVYAQQAADREDLMQEMIFQLWRSYQRYQSDKKFSTWMYQVCLNTAITYFRRKKREPEWTELPEESTEQLQTSTEDRFRLLEKAISTLREMDRALILLYLEARSSREMAEITGLSETNITTRISRIKDKLRIQIQTNIHV